MYSIETENLTKKYGDFVAVDHISFKVEKGEIFGLLGPNGAGKTTTIKMLTGLTPPTEGDAVIAGYSIRKNPIEVKSRIGWISSEVILDDDLTAWENLEIQARLTGVRNWKERATSLLKYFGILDFANRKTGKFSTGMRKKLEVSMALLNSPEVIFMDEPTIGLDVNTRATMWNLIREINRDYQVTILLTTHYMEEADSLCSRIGIINKGKIIALGTPEELKSRYGGDIIEIELKNGTNVNVGFENAVVTNGKVRIKVSNAETMLMDVIRAIGNDNIKGIKINKSSLDTVFINLTGGTIEEQDFDARRFYAMIRRARR
ncbi:Trehalose/maltose import ATP-binding protein MalK [Metallosphaera sp. J1]|uniref:ATP-binding cassette domain-containing protein n=1 Tax=Metallosphaera TaxID=41980 RepID=UPI001EE0BFE9|nr:ATP-binding cassette domain-containing protein [Metallosphaera javensis (ex Hofmann et al. 2022)]MCG3108910.1 Trehalose/maltose import ATP-binding protein MalK [Metallosphaera javensis (ex Hofmann et al. 2022)]BCS92258.1 MAG: trehalose/maltose import ATP-binding protein MalK [Metallosphaera javensis (ex Sakai et al. 2022)]